MADIRNIHEEIFNYLLNWSGDARYANGDPNPFFYIRNNNDKRFRDGYWFPGNEQYLCLSFWSGGDSLNKTPNIFFEVTSNSDCRAVMVARDSEDKMNYFSSMRSFLNESGIQYVPSKRKGIWERKFFSGKNVISNIMAYIKSDKSFIDRFVLDNDPKAYISDYSSVFGFIATEEFEDNYSRVKQRQEELIKQEAIAINTGRVERKAFETVISENAMQFSPGNLPFALREISIRNFQGIKHADINGLPQNNQWIFITGENGYGKSSLLQAITLGLCDDRALDNYLLEDTRIELIAHADLGTEPFIRLNSGLRGNLGQRIQRKVIAYGPVRLNTMDMDTRNRERKDLNDVMSLFQTATRLKNLQYEFFAKSHTAKRTFKQLELAVKEATNGRIDGVEVDGEDVLFRERLSNGEVLPPLKLEKLAAGFRSVINMVGDIIIRFSEKSPELDYKDYEGIVLIDEIENHLHPLLQRELPEALSEVFPRLQFIASTHSPIPLLGAPKNSVILTINRSVDEGITIERLDDQIDFANLLPNTILTSPIFGFEKIIPAANENISQISTVKDFATSEEIKSVKESLNLKSIDFNAIDRENDTHR